MEQFYDGDGDGLEVTNIEAPTGFSVDKTTVTLAVGASEQVTVTFSPTEGKSYNGQISISSNAGTETLNLLGEGAIVTGIDDDLIDQDEVQLYPNPSRDIVTIDLSLAPVVTPDCIIDAVLKPDAAGPIKARGTIKHPDTATPSTAIKSNL